MFIIDVNYCVLLSVFITDVNYCVLLSVFMLLCCKHLVCLAKLWYFSISVLTSYSQCSLQTSIIASYSQCLSHSLLCCCVVNTLFSQIVIFLEFSSCVLLSVFTTNVSYLSYSQCSSQTSVFASVFITLTVHHTHTHGSQYSSHSLLRWCVVRTKVWYAYLLDFSSQCCQFPVPAFVVSRDYIKIKLWLRA